MITQITVSRIQSFYFPLQVPLSQSTPVTIPYEALVDFVK